MRRPALVTVTALVMLLVSCQQGNPTEPPIPPGPSALSGRITGGNTAELNWTQCPDTNFLRYRLYRARSSGIQQNPDQATILLSTEDITQRSFSDTGLSAGHWYYAVQTENDDNLTSWSNEVHLQVQVQAKSDRP
ncbi:MAG: hypothetical protein R6V62_04235 [Candidatus Fermentibacteraceae bacterium]